MKIDLNEAEYQTVLDAVLSPNDYILVADAQRCVHALNRAPFGCSAQEFTGRDFLEFATPAHHPLIAEAAEQILAGAPPAELEVQGTDGRWYRMRIVGNTEHGVVQGYAVYLLDIDEAIRKEGERANLRAQLEPAESTCVTDDGGAERVRRHFDRLADALPVLISYVDGERRYRYNSAAYARWFGSSAAELQGRSLEDVMGARAYEKVRGHVDSALDGRPVSFETLLPYQGAGSRQVAVRYLPDVLEDGTVAGFYALIEDISGRKEAEALMRLQEDELRQLQKMEALGTLAGTIAHEFNNLLQVVINGCTSVLLSGKDGISCSGQIRPVIQAAQRGVSLTRQLLTFSRRHAEPIGVLDLDTELSDMAVLLAFLLGAGVSLELDLQADCRIRAEGGLIQQILVNLALNARDAMPEGGSLRVSTRCLEIGREEAAMHAGLGEGLHARLSVRDSGSGMDEATRARIFEPFFTTKAPDKGTGLGLSTVYAIVKQLGGHIDVESAPGRGTAFHLYFPSHDRVRGA